MGKKNIQILRKDKFEDLKEIPYKDLKGSDHEDELQQLIFDNPSLLKRDFLVLILKFGIQGKEADAIAVDKAGNFYIIETKLSYNHTSRQIIAQLLDYGSLVLPKALVDPDVDKKINEKVFDSLFYKINESMKGEFKKRIREAFSFSEADYVRFFDTFKQNLMDNRLIYCIVMDEVEDYLINNARLLSEYVDPKCSITIFEVKKFRDVNGSILYSSTLYEFGKQLQYPKKNSKRSKWDEQRFIDELKSKFSDSNDLNTLKAIIEWSRKKFSIVGYGTGGIIGSFNPKFNKFSKRSVFTLKSDGSLVINFGWMDDSQATKEKAQLLKKRFSEIFPNISFENQYPRLEFYQWKDSLDKIKSALNIVLT